MARAASTGAVVLVDDPVGDRAALGPGDHLRQGVPLEVLAHVLADLVPDGQQHALPFVVARPVLVRQPEVTRLDGAVDGAHDLGQGDGRRIAVEDVAAAHASFRAHQPGAFEGEQDLFEVGLGEAGTAGDVAPSWGPYSSACNASESSALLA